MSFRARFWPTLFSLVGLVLLVSLGSWQLNRYIDARQFERERDATMDLDVVSVDSPRPLADGELDFRHIEVRGQWDDERLFLIKHRIYQGTPGFWIVHPLHLSGDEMEAALLVNRGWVSVDDGPDIAEQLLADESHDTGHAKGLIHRLDDVVTDDSFHAMLDGDQRHLGVIELESYDTTAMNRVLPSALNRPIVLTQVPDGEADDEYPLASLDHITEPYLTAETHFGYMLTWYFLALALIAIWIAHGLGLLNSPAYASDGGDRQRRESDGDRDRRSV